MLCTFAKCSRPAVPASPLFKWLNAACHADSTVCSRWSNPSSVLIIELEPQIHAKRVWIMSRGRVNRQRRALGCPRESFTRSSFLEMSFGRPPTFSTFTATPPDRGSFPLDHDGESKAIHGLVKKINCLLGECKAQMMAYLKCLKSHESASTPCRALSKTYLDCRMNKLVHLPFYIRLLTIELYRGLMEKDNWHNLGLDSVDASSKDPTKAASSSQP